jgi:TetR/AcrR family fatty acid metabolism transcriptional regulator
MSVSRRSGDERRRQIARSVLALATERGVSGISVAAVAARIGVAPSALYRHYPSKDAMLDATLEHIASGVLANLAAVGAEHREPLDALGRLLERHIELIQRNRGIPLVVFSEDFFRDVRRRRRLVAMMQSYRGGIESLVREAQRRGRVRAALDPSTLSLMFFGLFQAPAIHWHLSGGRADLADHARRAWSVFHRGIRTTRGHGARRGRTVRRGRAREVRA